MDEGSHELGKVTTWNNSRWLAIDTALATGRARVDELNSSLGLDASDWGVGILGDDVSSVH